MRPGVCRTLRAILSAAVCAGLVTTVAAGTPRQTGLEDPQQCQPLAAAEDPQATLDATRGALLPLLGALPAAQHLFDEYLTAGIATSVREDVVDAMARGEFRHAPATLAAERTLLAQVRAKLERDGAPRLKAPARPAGGTLARLGLGAHLDIAYALGFDTPGLIAGGTGSVDSAAGSFSDDRTISGSYELRPTASRRGVLRRVRLRLEDAQLRLLDSIDFCPGGLGGSAGIALGTLAMSRLERTPHPAGGTYAKPILWRLQTPLDPVGVPVTSLYRRNDRDRDGIPDRQPWRRAHFKLDPCPRHPGACPG